MYKIDGDISMNKVMLIYPPGKAYQRSEDRAQCNLDESAVATIHACNDLGYAASVLRNRNYFKLFNQTFRKHFILEVVFFHNQDNTI